MTETKDRDLYARLGGYDAIAARRRRPASPPDFRSGADPLLGPSPPPTASAGEAATHRLPLRLQRRLLYYTGRDMPASHRAWASQPGLGALPRHLKADTRRVQGADRERGEVLAFVESLRKGHRRGRVRNITPVLGPAAPAWEGIWRGHAVVKVRGAW